VRDIVRRCHIARERPSKSWTPALIKIKACGWRAAEADSNKNNNASFNIGEAFYSGGIT